MKQLTLNETAAFLLQNDNFVLLTHRRPDGDTIGCASALCGGLRAIGKRAFVLENPQFTEKFRPYLDGLTCEKIPGSACIVSVDVATEELLPDAARDCAVELLIDHHGSNTGFAIQGYVEPDTAACGEIILRIMQAMKVPINSRIAEAVYVAISTDTGCFRYSNVTAETLRAAAVCKDCGADTFSVNRVMFLTKRLARLRLEAHLTETTEFYANRQVAVSVILQSLREELGLTEDDIDDISGFGREIAGVEIAVMLREEGTRGKVSVRSAPQYDASKICALLGGGGHRAAAGATIDGGIEAAKQAVLDAIAASGVVL